MPAESDMKRTLYTPRRVTIVDNIFLENRTSTGVLGGINLSQTKLLTSDKIYNFRQKPWFQNELKFPVLPLFRPKNFVH
jgi:hypothetical protein